MWVCGGRAFQVEGSASTKALGQEYLQCVLKQYLPLDWRKWGVEGRLARDGIRK